MSSELADLPLKSLELPTKTVAKLKPLGIKTVRDLYAHSLAALVGVGLVQRELEEIAEAASDFGVSWHTKAEVAAASGAPPVVLPVSKAKPAPVAAKAPGPTRTKLALPGDVATAFATDATIPSQITDADIDAFKGFVDATGIHFKTPPPSARHLELVRRMALVQSASIGGPQRTYFVGLIDISTFPQGRAAELDTFLSHVGNLVASMLDRVGIKRSSHGRTGCAVQFAITAKDTPKARALLAAHAAWIGNGAPFASPVPAAYQAIADAGTAALR